MNDNASTGWPDLAESLYERLTGRNAEIAYDFENFALEVPRDTAPDSPRATWRVNGILRVTTTNGIERGHEMESLAR